MSRYDKLTDIVYDSRIKHHGAFYGSTGCGKSRLIKDLLVNGKYSHCRTVVFLNGKTGPIDKDLVSRMQRDWRTNVYSYSIASKEELSAKMCEIETAFVKHRVEQYAKLKLKPPDDVNMKPGMGFGNMLIIMDDLHKEVLGSQTVAQKFQSIRHVGIQLLFITQSFKNGATHDLIKENYGYVVFFNLTQNRISLYSYMADLSVKRAPARNCSSRSSLEYIYTRLARMNDKLLKFGEEDTCYMYVEIPKRTCKSVSCVRTAIANIEYQACFEETGTESVKVHISKRTAPLAYNKRFDAPLFRILSEDEQNAYVDGKQSKEEVNLPTEKKKKKKETLNDNKNDDDDVNSLEEEKEDDDGGETTGCEDNVDGEVKKKKIKEVNKPQTFLKENETGGKRYVDRTVESVDDSESEDDMYRRAIPPRNRKKRTDYRKPQRVINNDRSRSFVHSLKKNSSGERRIQTTTTTTKQKQKKQRKLNNINKNISCSRYQQQHPRADYFTREDVEEEEEEEDDSRNIGRREKSVRFPTKFRNVSNTKSYVPNDDSYYAGNRGIHTKRTTKRRSFPYEQLHRKKTATPKQKGERWRR